MGVKRYHIEKDAVRKQHLKDLQAGRTSVGFDFTATGEENVPVTVSFPTPFAAKPAVAVSIEGIDVGIVRVGVTKSDFTLTVRDDKGTDYTSTQTATVSWIAVSAE